MGVVYLAEREDLGNRVAIKILRDASLSPARRERFASEQRTLAQLNHPFIARLYDADTLADGTPWFVMEYVEGDPLTEYCAKHESSAQERLQLFRAVCEAVQYAHGHAVIHRDLKPSNILVKRDRTVRLLDFGIAKQLEGLDAAADQTRTALRLMTPAYAAPELIRGDRVGVHTDVYSLGVILYELLAGRLPFDLSNRTPGEAAALIAEHEPEKPSAAAKRVEGLPGARARVPSASKTAWADLDVLCLAAMHKDPKRRYPSVDALIRDVDHFLKGEPLEARPDTLGYTLGKFVRRNWQAVSAAALLFAVAVGLALLVGLGVSMRHPKQAPPSSPRARTVAVLPFQNAGSDHSLDFLCLALPEEVATTLGYNRSLTVQPFDTTATNYNQSNLDLQKAGRKMLVASIVTGHFLRAGDQLQITLETFDVESNRLVWRDTFNVPVHNLMAMQAQIAAKASGALAPVLGAPALATDTAVRPKNEEAYDLFLRSLPLSGDPAPNKQAIAMLEKSVALDETYVPAWLVLSNRYYIALRYNNGGEVMRERQMASLERVQALDPNNLVAGATAPIRDAERGELVKGYRGGEGLLRRYPDNGLAHFGLSYVLRYAGLLQESANQCETAFLLDAHTSGMRSCAVVFILRGDYSRAMDYIQIDAGSEWAKALTMDTLVRQGKEKEALQVGPASVPQWAGYDMFLACVQHRPAAEIVALARGVRPVDDPEENYFAAGHLAYCGQANAAVKMLKRTIEGHYCSYPAIDSDPFFASLRVKPEFADMRSAAIACQIKFLAERGPPPK